MIDAKVLKNSIVSVLKCDHPDGLIDFCYYDLATFPADIVFDLENKKIADFYEKWCRLGKASTITTIPPSTRKLSIAMAIDLKFYFYISTNSSEYIDEFIRLNADNMSDRWNIIAQHQMLFIESLHLKEF